MCNYAFIFLELMVFERKRDILQAWNCSRENTFCCVLTNYYSLRTAWMK